MSKSWIIMSRNRPPDRWMYAIGGGAGSREVICTSSTAPMRPRSISSRRRRNEGSNRRLNPIISGTPRRTAAATPRSARDRSRSMGFSQKIALPAAAAFSI